MRRFLLPLPTVLLVLASAALPSWSGDEPSVGAVLPFPPTPSASKAAPRLQDSTMKRRVEPGRLPKDAPNILVVLIDDVGYGIPDTFGGPVHTPTLSRLSEEGIAYNRFHTTSICSPTRAALLTGRNHQRVGSGTIAERAVDWDGYTGIIPRTSATMATVLRHYGYTTSAFGKWHNTPATQTTAMGPFDYWPNAYGFDHFYGFLAGETSQWEPRLVENRNAVEPPHDETYHLTEDMADQALRWLKRRRAFTPDKPFLMYWAPGAVHGPHHVFPKWADKYKGRFDDGWDAMRKETFQRQKELGWIPADTELTPRAETMAAWKDIPEDQRAFQTRLMEVFAGFVEHTDAQVGKLVDGIEQMGLRENTVIFYIWGDNGSSAEGQAGSISELLAQNQIPNTIAQQMKALDGLGGLDALGGPLVDNMYHAGWAWAGSTPFHHTKLIASHFGGTRNPMVVSWPKGIQPDPAPRQQFHHVNDIAPTVYELLEIEPPKEVDGFVQDPIDGVSMAYSFASAGAVGPAKTQYFDNNGSRGIYHEGWYACTFGPLIPWVNAQKGLADWDSAKDVWELYDLRKDFSQMHDLAAQQPEKLEQLKRLFLEQAQDNQVFPIGAGIWLRLHPEDLARTPYKRWVFDQSTTRMPEFTAPGLGRESNIVTIDLEVGDGASGVLYALGGASGGLCCYLDVGHLVYEYNLMIIERTIARVEPKLVAGKHRVVIETTIAKPGAPADVVITIDGKEAARARTKRTVPLAFTASESFDVGVDLGSPVSGAYAARRPFAFEGTIQSVEVTLR